MMTAPSQNPPTLGLDRLRQALQDQPSLQEQVFEIRNAAEFVETLARLAAEEGCAVEPDALMAALQQGRRDWIERDLP